MKRGLIPGNCIEGDDGLKIKLLQEKTIVPQNRFRSWSLWLSVAALVAFVTKTYFDYEIPQFDTLVNLILVVLTGFGILNNPSDSTSF